MRFDRAITLGLEHLRRLHRPYPTRSDDGLHKTESVMPILMYHSIANDAEADTKPYYRTTTHPEQFAMQMAWIEESGFIGVTLREGLLLLGAARNTGRRPVVITFDDGFEDFYLNAYPVLQRHQFSATMYLPTDYIKDERATFNSRSCLIWDEVRALRDSGIEFGGHSQSHRTLYDLQWTDIVDELALSKKTIEEELGETVTSFAYPYAFPQEDPDFIERLADLLVKYGYQTCVTTIVGRMTARDNKLSLRRIPINQCDDIKLFVSKLEGSYDWLRMPQFIRRMVVSSLLGRQKKRASLSA
jgi:peptidoglycan/xylan/chitin deacetylase (PgdA/CDA1 family)